MRRESEFKGSAARCGTLVELFAILTISPSCTECYLAYALLQRIPAFCQDLEADYDSTHAKPPSD